MGCQCLGGAAAAATAAAAAAAARFLPRRLVPGRANGRRRRDFAAAVDAVAATVGVAGGGVPVCLPAWPSWSWGKPNILAALKPPVRLWKTESLTKETTAGAVSRTWKVWGV